jgi:hypothetical protein
MMDPVEYLRDVASERDERSGSATQHRNRLAEALRTSGGYVAVIARRKAWADAMLEAALPEVDPGCTIHVKASEGPERALELFSRALPRGISADKEPRAKLEDLVVRARDAGKTILVVVDDADTAAVEDLERLRVFLDVGDGRCIDTLKLVLIGTPALRGRLADPAASALQSRVSAFVRARRRSGKPEAQPARPSYVRRVLIPLAAVAATAALLLNVPQVGDALRANEQPWLAELKALAARVQEQVQSTAAMAKARLAPAADRGTDIDESRDDGGTPAGD